MEHGEAPHSVLREADLVAAECRTVIYRLKMSVLEEALLGFAEGFGLRIERATGSGESAEEEDELT